MCRPLGPQAGGSSHAASSLSCDRPVEPGGHRRGGCDAGRWAGTRLHGAAHPWPQHPRTGEVEAVPPRGRWGGLHCWVRGSRAPWRGGTPVERRRRCVLGRSGVNLRRARGGRGVVRSSPPSGPRPGRPGEVRCEPLVAGAGAVWEGAFRRWRHSRQGGVGAGALDRSGLNLRCARGGHRSDHTLVPSPARGSGELGQVRCEPQVARVRARPAGWQPRRSTVRGSPAGGSDAVVGDRVVRCSRTAAAWTGADSAAGLRDDGSASPPRVRRTSGARSGPRCGELACRGAVSWLGRRDLPGCGRLTGQSACLGAAPRRSRGVPGQRLPGQVLARR